MPVIFEQMDSLHAASKGILSIEDDVRVLDERTLRDGLVDDLVYSAVFSGDEGVREACRWLIRRAGWALGIYSASIQPLYEAMGRREVSGFTVPAINIRTLTYHTAQAILQAAMKGKAGFVIFEIARSEIDYTKQRPAEYTAAVLAAAVKTGWKGPIFLQGDHFQVNAGRYAKDPDKELRGVKDLIWEAIEGGFYNIDIDTSTLVDLSKPTVREQQYLNYSLAAELTTMIRDLEPEGITISVGGEIGEVGGKNSTVEELNAYMEGFLEILKQQGENLKGISKMSVQTGTSHGGVPLPDGTVAQVKLDFETLKRLSEEARARWGLSGAVQHGASTLPNEAFDRFPATGTAEIHLATGFQNIVYDSPAFPAPMKEKIYGYLKTEMAGERKASDTEEQFLYKTRKKGFGPFKRELWGLPDETLSALSRELENQFAFFFGKLNMHDTEHLVARYIQPVDAAMKKPAGL
jgi:fructose/tagatose bisphosphate aldolase